MRVWGCLFLTAGLCACSQFPDNGDRAVDAAYDDGATDAAYDDAAIVLTRAQHPSAPRSEQLFDPRDFFHVRPFVSAHPQPNAVPSEIELSAPSIAAIAPIARPESGMSNGRMHLAPLWRARVHACGSPCPGGFIAHHDRLLYFRNNMLASLDLANGAVVSDEGWPTYRSEFRTPVTASDIIVVATNRPSEWDVLGMDVRTLATRWRVHRATWSEVLRTVDNVALVSTMRSNGPDSDVIDAYDAQNGALLYRLHGAGQPPYDSFRAGTGRGVFIVSRSVAMALDVPTGTVRWRVAGDFSRVGGYVWRAGAGYQGGPFGAMLAATDSHVLVRIGNEREVGVLDARTGRTVGRFPIGGIASGVARSHTAYYGELDGTIVSRALPSGRLRWRRSLSSPCMVMHLDDDRLYVWFGDDGLYVLDARTGATRWRYGLDGWRNAVQWTWTDGPARLVLANDRGDMAAFTLVDGAPPRTRATLFGRVRVLGAPSARAEVFFGRQRLARVDARGHYRGTVEAFGDFPLSVRVPGRRLGEGCAWRARDDAMAHIDRSGRYRIDLTVEVLCFDAD